jgi:murein L,D-transpeptidase YafK
MSKQRTMTIAAIVLGALVVTAMVGLAWWQRPRPGPPSLAAEDRRADLIEVHKAERRLELKRGGAVLRHYRIALGFDPVGHKEREGDGRTPEGAYVIDWRNPKSRFHLSLHVSYPDERDQARAAARSQSPGGDIMIHGQPNGLSRLTTGHPRRDWTVGCVAVTNREMREIWSLVADGTPIVIRP